MDKFFFTVRGEGQPEDEFFDTFDGAMDYLIELGTDLAYLAGDLFLAGHIDVPQEEHHITLTVITGDFGGVRKTVIEAKREQAFAS